MGKITRKKIQLKKNIINYFEGRGGDEIPV